MFPCKILKLDSLCCDFITRVLAYSHLPFSALLQNLKVTAVILQQGVLVSSLAILCPTTEEKGTPKGKIDLGESSNALNAMIHGQFCLIQCVTCKCYFSVSRFTDFSFSMWNPGDYFSRIVTEVVLKWGFVSYGKSEKSWYSSVGHGKLWKMMVKWFLGNKKAREMSKEHDLFLYLEKYWKVDWKLQAQKSKNVMYM